MNKCHYSRTVPFTTIQAPFPGNCGVFYSWEVIWNLGSPALNGGIVLQHTTIKGSITDINGNQVPFKNKDFVEELNSIAQGGTITGHDVDDWWSWGTSFSGTFGTITLTGDARFYDNGSANTPPGFKNGSPSDPTTGPFSYGPMPPGGGPTLHRTLTAKWNCICGDEPTAITYP